MSFKLIFLLLTGDKMSKSCCAGLGHGHLAIKMVLLLLFRGDEYQGHVAQVEFIAM